MKLIVCTDDICPGFIAKYWEHWETLKKKHPGLKLNAFVIPHYGNNDKELITNDYFKNWYEIVKSWVRINLHGYAHTYPPEGLVEYNKQLELLSKGLVLLKQYTDKLGMKSPGYYSSKDTLRIATELQLEFICNMSSIDFINGGQTYRVINPPLIQTHTNGLCPDSIEKITDKLNILFKDATFSFIEEVQ